VTPENIGFRYQLAGPFRRAPAYLLDLITRLCIIALALALLITFGILGGGVSTLLASFSVAIGLVGYFLLSWFYGVFFETYYNGRTPGKWLLGIRVIGSDGHPISGKQALLRNLVRVADMAPIATLPSFDSENTLLSFFPLTTGLVGVITMLCTRRLQRLGDLAAGTMVVIDERNWSIPVAKVEDHRVPALASFVPADFRVSPTMAKALAGYAERRAYLSPGRRREIAKHLAVPLLERFEFRPDIDPDLLLYALYYRTFLADEHADPPDLGELAGFSPLLKDAEVAA
jgi:uncharacterized RDD family membrane protein YckC